MPIAHQAGVRHLAMEALNERFASEANQTRRVPSIRLGYLGQESLRALIADALAVSWDLVPYECDFTRWQGERGPCVRELARCRGGAKPHQVPALSSSDLKLLVWCGNSHQRKAPQAIPASGPRAGSGSDKPSGS